MTRAALEHILRAASAIANEREFVVIGSQAVLGQYPDAPAPESSPYGPQTPRSSVAQAATSITAASAAGSSGALCRVLSFTSICGI